MDFCRCDWVEHAYMPLECDDLLSVYKAQIACAAKGKRRYLLKGSTGAASIVAYLRYAEEADPAYKVGLDS